MEALRAELAASEEARRLAEEALLESHGHLSRVLSAAEVTQHELTALQSEISCRAAGVSSRNSLTSALVGVGAGIFPVPGLSLIVAHAMMLKFGGDAAIVLAVCVLATPMQIAAMPLLIDFGGTIIGASPLRFEMQSFATDFTCALMSLRFGLLGWGVLVLLLAVLIPTLLPPAAQREQPARHGN